MSEPFIGEIKAFGFNFAPSGWSTCNGQLLNIAQNAALFSILGTYYGGDGRTTFGLPDLRGRASMHFGQGTGLSNRVLGSSCGEESVGLTTDQIPSHSHPLTAKNVTADSDSPGGNMLANSVKPAGRETGPMYSYSSGMPAASMAAAAIASAGNGQAHYNMQPYTVVNMCIALTGIYPARS